MNVDQIRLEHWRDADVGKLIDQLTLWQTGSLVRIRTLGSKLSRLRTQRAAWLDTNLDYVAYGLISLNVVLTSIVVNNAWHENAGVNQMGWIAWYVQSEFAAQQQKQLHVSSTSAIDSGRFRPWWTIDSDVTMAILRQDKDQKGYVYEETGTEEWMNEWPCRQIALSLGKCSSLWRMLGASCSLGTELC